MIVLTVAKPSPSNATAAHNRPTVKIHESCFTLYDVSVGVNKHASNSTALIAAWVRISDQRSRACNVNRRTRLNPIQNQDSLEIRTHEILAARMLTIRVNIHAAKLFTHPPRRGLHVYQWFGLSVLWGGMLGAPAANRTQTIPRRLRGGGVSPYRPDAARRWAAVHPTGCSRGR